MDRAIADYSKAIEFNSKFSEAYTFRGYAYQLRGKTEDRAQALADYTKALKIDPNNELAKKNSVICAASADPRYVRRSPRRFLSAPALAVVATWRLGNANDPLVPASAMILLGWIASALPTNVSR